jgi:hypothetical protein
MSIKRIRPEDDPDAIAVPATFELRWDDDDAFEAARPSLENIARIVAGILDRVHTTTAAPDQADNAA